MGVRVLDTVLMPCCPTLRCWYSVLATSGAIDLSKLCIIPGKQCWVLYLDMLVSPSPAPLPPDCFVATVLLHT